MTNKKPPVFLNLFQIHMPVMAVLSILHRITGLLLCLIIPVIIYLLDLSLRSEESYMQVLSIIDQTAVKVLLVFIVWGLSHHFFAGIRYLLLDIDVGVKRDAARASAWCVHALAAAVLVVAMIVLL